MVPVRVPMTRPSAVENPMVVAMLRPCSIAHMLAPLPRWAASNRRGRGLGTRTGTIDPGVLIALMRDDHMDIAGLENLLYRRSGLLGLSGISADMRVLLASDAPEAKEAVDYYCYSAARHAGSLVAALGGLDAIVFTGGIGENAGPVRARILGHLKWLGLDEGAIYIVPANEELTIARHVAALLHK